MERLEKTWTEVVKNLKETDHEWDLGRNVVNIMVQLKEMWFEGKDCIHLSQDSAQ